MNYELLNYLKSSSNRDWLWCWDRDSNKRLEQIIEDKVAQISLVAKCSHKPAIFIVETKPINFIAAFLAGIITEVDVFLGDPAWQIQEWQQVLNLVQPDLIFGDETIKFELQSLRVKLKLRSQNASDLVTNIKLTKFIDQPLIMIPTGGTSGKIKFAMHSWQTLTASVNGFKNFFDCQNINSVCTLPLYHVSGLMQLMRSLLTQGNLIICPYQLIVTKLNNFNKSAYFISLVPTQLQFLLESTPHCLQEFKTVLVGGAPPRRSLLNTAREYNIPIALTYGMTETASGVVALKPEDFLAGNNSSGQVLPHAEIEISNTAISTAKQLQLENPKSSQDQIGLIQINSTALCWGYYPQVFPLPQEFITDDVGYFDGEGYLHLLGRNSEKIITGGENVFPAEIEAVIYATKLVEDICVIGIADQKWGQAVTAIYVPLKSADDLNLIKQQLRSQLAKYKQPKHWLEVNNIPRNNRGKVNYQQLKAIALQIMGNK
ncbi:MAG: 2-succinylbenzoate--CoA ligase [Pleurocapsa sp. SU_5_0]|nr:2-succinylbenzoate--CoA ligase [Pleurocapsa sp. SU_5_0]